MPKIKDNSQMQYIYNYLCPILQDNIWKCNIKPEDAVKINIETTYWTDVLKSWAELNFFEPQNYNEITSQTIRYNSHIVVNSNLIKPVKELVVNGVITVGQLLTNGKWKSQEDIETEYKVQLPWLWYKALRSAMPPMWKYYIHNYCLRNRSEDVEPCLHDQVKTNKKTCALMYNKFIDKSSYDIYKYYQRLEATLGSPTTWDNYCTFFLDLYKITDIIKLRNFQYHLLLGKVFTNNTLYKWKVVASPMCQLCTDQVETPSHMLTSCNCISVLWMAVKKLIKEEYEMETNWNGYNVIYNNVHAKPGSVINLITLQCKHYIFQQKCLGNLPTIKGLMKEISFLHKYELKYCRDVSKVSAKWKPVKTHKLDVIYKN